MIEAKIDDVIGLTRQLVRLPGEAGREKRVADFLMDFLPTRGFVNVARDPNGNVIARVRGDGPGKVLLLDAHMDTVGIAPNLPWKFDPFEGRVDSGRLYGRGTADMKGALAGMITAMSMLDPAHIQGEVVLSASVMEEVLEGVALKAVMDRVRPDYVLIGEASDLRIIRAGRGRAEIKVTAHGRPAHTSSPQHGINAVEAIMPAISKISMLELPSHHQTESAVIVLTDIISDPYPGHSVIPSSCTATYDRRLVPGETREAVLAPLRDLPTIPGAYLEVHLETGVYPTYTGTSLSKDKWFPAWVLEDDHPLLINAIRGLESIGLTAQLGSYNFCTNAAYSMGEAGIPTIGFGPSTEKMAHIVNEYVEIEALRQATRGYKAIIESVLGF